MYVLEIEVVKCKYAPAEHLQHSARLVIYVRIVLQELRCHTSQ
jgi:hypothetical protein